MESSSDPKQAPAETVKENTALFSRVEFLGNLSEPLRAEVESKFRERSYPPDTLLLREGGLNDHFCILKEGAVEVLKKQSEHEFQLGVLHPGECFGEISVFEDTNPFATIRALTEVTILEIATSQLRAIMEMSQDYELEIYRALFKTLTQRLRSTSRLSLMNEELISLSLSQKKDLEEALTSAEDREKALQEANHRLHVLGQEQNEFLGHVVHDLRNPLSIIENYLSLMEEELEGVQWHKVKPMADAMHRQISSMLQLIGDLLDLAKIDAAVVHLNFDRVNLVSFLRDNANTWRKLAERSGIKLVCLVQGDLPDVLADEQKLQEILQNLLSNALKFTKAEGTITIDAKQRTEDEVIVTISDTGLGIMQDEIRKLFEKFVKLSTRPVSGEKQHGLGLAIVKKLVRLHRGEVWAESTLGKGSSFHFTLPIYHGQKSP
ncbi:MAG: ATP-binding protein [Planctomycetes bacterium]|nr:ATP-binding protein [Planctomycetota bacterium]